MDQSRRKSILLVEDEAIIALSEKATLVKQGYDVTIVGSGEEAISIFEQKKNISLVLMDIDLGRGIDGTAAARRILEISDVPIVFLTSHTEREYVAKVKEITRYGYIIKKSGDFVLQSSIEMAFELSESHTRTREKEQLYLQTLASIPKTSIALFDRDMRYQITPGEESNNSGFDDLFIQGETLEDVERPDVVELFTPLYEKALRGEKSLFEMEFEGQAYYQQVLPIFNLAGEVTNGMVITHNITDLKRAEMDLRKGETMLRSILDTIPQAVFWKDEESVYLGCNKTFADSVGVSSPSDVKGKTDFELRFPPKDAEAYRRDDRFVISNNVPKRHIIEQIQYRDGTRGWIDTTKMPLVNDSGRIYGVLGVYEDITKRKIIEELLRAEEDRYRKLFMYSPNGILIADAQSYYLDANPEMCAMLGYSREELIGKHASEIVGEAEVDYIAPALESIKSDANYHREWKFKRRDGSLFPAEVKATAMPDGTLMGIVSDITERRRAESENRQLLEEKTVLLREVHHRIKNNIASVESLLMLKANSIDRPEVRGIFQDAIGRVQTMHVLYDMLSGTENYITVQSKAYFESLISAIVAIFPNASEVAIERSIADAPLEAKLIAKLGIIVNELMTNAFKYAFDGSKAGLLRVSCLISGQALTLIISDNGRGLPAGPGSGRAGGFGLSLVDMLAREIGATLTIQSDSGTTFRLECPV